MEEMARLFVGLPLSEEARSSLWTFARTLTDCRPVRRDMYHITLCFLGMRPCRDMERIARTVSGVERPPLTLTLGGAGSFKKGDILWAGLLDPPEALFSYQKALARALDMEEEIYRPHITLARHAAHARFDGAPRPVTFTVPSVILYESLRENERLVYRPRHTFAI